MGPALGAPAQSAEQGEQGDESGWGEGEDDGDEAGFGSSDAVDPPAPIKPPSPLHFGGTLKTEEAVWLESRKGSPLAQVRQSLDLWLGLHAGIFRARVSGHGEFDFAYLADPGTWQQATLDEYQSQLALREAWVSATTGPLDTTLGRQVVSFGQGRSLSVLDVATPRDQREPGMVDLADLRLPVSMARLSLGLQSDGFWSGSHRFEVMVIPESDFGYRSPPTGPFGALPGVIADEDLTYSVNGIDDFEALIDNADIAYRHVQPRWDLGQIQGLGRWSWRGRGVDLSVMGGSVLDQQGVFDLPDLIGLVTAANQGESISIDLDHHRYTILGHDGAAQTPWFLLRWELAWKHSFPVNVGTVIDTSQGFVPVFDVRTEQPDLYQGLLGASWSGWKGTTLDLDLIQGFMPERPQDLIYPVDTSAWALRANKPLLKQRMAVEAVIMGWGWEAQSGWAGRAAVSYQIMDGLVASLLAITYHPGTERGPILGLDTHDRAQASLRWDF